MEVFILPEDWLARQLRELIIWLNEEVCQPPAGWESSNIQPILPNNGLGDLSFGRLLRVLQDALNAVHVHF